MNRLQIVIIDGQGGRMGKGIVEQLKKRFPDLPLTAVGTNSIATAAMMKAGADWGATGENPVVVNSRSQMSSSGLWASSSPTLCLAR